MNNNCDTIVIGSGIGGLACAAALSKLGHKVQVFEQHYVAGGLTHTFKRNGFSWDVGLHYLGNMGPEEQGEKILSWLSNGSIRMAPVKSVYDIIHFPDFEISFASPTDALKEHPNMKFPGSSKEINDFFLLMHRFPRYATAPFRMHTLPGPLAWVYSLWAKRSIRRWWGRTINEVLMEMIGDPRLRAVLTAQWPDHGGSPAEGSFAMHVMIMNHYLNGAYYPAGGSGIFAESLIPVIENAGGEVKVKTPVKDILLQNGKAIGVRFEDGSECRAKRTVSAIGVQDTLHRLLPVDVRGMQWGREILSFKPSGSHLCLYLGFEGDIKAGGASSANHWFYETWDTNAAVWENPADTPHAPMLFVSFASLKDPQHKAGEKQKHTGEVLAMVNWNDFRQWESSRHGNRPADYQTLKNAIEQKMLAQFKRYFPGLAPLIVYHELSTPLSTAHFIGRRQGASYGIETTPRRFLSRYLNVRTPVKGLYLAGQDVITPGITGAMMGGVLAAAAIDFRVFRHL
jgi:all-trans-retinol 13,14-reductase